MKEIESYFSKHTKCSFIIPILIGIGIGMLLTYPLAGSHPVRWGLGFLSLGILGHFYPLIRK